MIAAMDDRYGSKSRSIRSDIQAQNFARLTFDDHLERPAAYFTVGREVLRWNTGVNDQFEALTAERTLDGLWNLHD